jgi:hypothetical protein
LTICEQCDHTLAEECGDQWLDLKFVDMGCSLLAAKAIVEEELVVLNVLSDAIDFDFWLVDLNAWVED